MAETRLIGSYPVIGIRPTIDGRRGNHMDKRTAYKRNDNNGVYDSVEPCNIRTFVLLR